MRKNDIYTIERETIATGPDGPDRQSIDAYVGWSLRSFVRSVALRNETNTDTGTREHAAGARVGDNERPKKYYVITVMNVRMYKCLVLHKRTHIRAYRPVRVLRGSEKYRAVYVYIAVDEMQYGTNKRSLINVKLRR